ncbi:CPBP family intramembrane glutamic endopeptidase [Salinifilum ghardaiensis]
MVNAVERGNALLDGPERGRRSTGPALGAVVVLACLLAGQYLAGLVLFPLLGASPLAVLRGDVGPVDQAAMLLTGAGALVLLALWLRFREVRPFGSLGFPLARRVPAVLLGGAAVAAVALSLPVAINLLSGQYEVRAAGASAVVLALLPVFAVQASTEEVLTRGYLLQVTHRRWGLPAALAVQAVLFALLHVTNLEISVIALVNILLIGVLLGLWAVAEGGLWGVCAFHTVWNWAQGNVYGIEVSGMDLGTTWWDVSADPAGATPITGGGFGVEGSAITTLVLAALLTAVVLVLRRARPAAAGQSR